MAIINNNVLIAGGGSDIKAELLWTNNDIGSAFPSQTVTLSKSLADFDGVFIEYWNNVSGNTKRLGYYISKSGGGSQKYFLSYAGTDWNKGHREVTTSFADSVWFGNYSVSNNWACVPIKIFGLKGDL